MEQVINVQFVLKGLTKVHPILVRIVLKAVKVVLVAIIVLCANLDTSPSKIPALSVILNALNA